MNVLFPITALKINVSDKCPVSFVYCAFLTDIDAIKELADILLLNFCRLLYKCR